MVMSATSPIKLGGGAMATSLLIDQDRAAESQRHADHRIISACFSGSLIPSEAPNRIIFDGGVERIKPHGVAAARSKILSSSTPYSVMDSDPSLSWLQINRPNCASRRSEEEDKLAASEPQIFIGTKMRDAANQSLVKFYSIVLRPQTRTPKAATKSKIK